MRTHLPDLPDVALTLPLVLLFLGCTVSGADDPPPVGTPQDAVAGAAPWKGLALVIRNTDVTWPDGAGDTSRLVARLSAAEEQAALADVENVPALLRRWSAGMAELELEVKTVEDTVRRISEVGPGDYWVGMTDVEAVLDAHAPAGAYDSVWVIFDGDDDAGRGLPVTSYWGHLAVDASTNGATYASMIASSETVSAAADRGEAYVHEWLHGAGAYFRSAAFDVPDPHDNPAFGFDAPAADGSWRDWYQALLSGAIARAGGAPAGYTPGVWRSRTPRAAAAGITGPSTAPAADRPRVRAAYATFEWIYLEWEPVDDAATYRIFAVSDAGPFTTREEPGASDRGPFLYAYVHRDELCGELAAGPQTAWVQVWPGDDASRAENGIATGAIQCP